MIEGVVFRVRWVAQPGCCQRCAWLHDREWEVDELEEATVLKDTMSHPNCKCEVDVEIDVDTERLKIW